jgi:hypothetical protein
MDPGIKTGTRLRVFIRVPGYPFRALDRGKGNTRHRPRHTTRPTGNEPGWARPGRAGPKFGSSARARPGPSGNWNFQARPDPFSALLRTPLKGEGRGAEREGKEEKGVGLWREGIGRRREGRGKEGDEGRGCV